MKKNAPMTSQASLSAGDPAAFVLWHWTDDPVEAAACARAGIDRIGIDLDRLGKIERQSGLQSWISPHQLTSLPSLRKAMPDHCLFVRTNPLHPGSRNEIEAALAGGADLLMLPNFQKIEQVVAYLELVAGRVPVIPLVERKAALELIEPMAALGISEVHFGLNDLSLDFMVQNRLSLFLHPDMEQVFAKAHSLFARFGVGGVASPDIPGLPVPASTVLAQHGRIRSNGAMLARCFWTGCDRHNATQIKKRVHAIRDTLAVSAALPPDTVRQRLAQYMQGQE